jgi:hypothetical protein
MTSSGTNTWSVPLLINNLEAQIGSGGGGGGAIFNSNSVNVSALPYTFTPAGLIGATIYSSVNIPIGGITLTLPSKSDWITYLGASASLTTVVKFYIGNMRQYGGPYPSDATPVICSTSDTSCYMQQNLPFGSAKGASLTTGNTQVVVPSNITLASGNMWDCSVIISPEGSGRVLYCFNFMGIAPQSS